MLTGEKVVLRPLQRSDLKTLYEHRTDLEVLLLGDDEPPKIETFEDFETRLIELQKQGEQVMFAIDVDDRVIGGISLYNVDPLARNCELGIVIGERDYWGRGYGRDAVEVALRYAFRYLNYHRVHLSTWSDNERALRSYHACGFVEEARLRQHVWNDGRYKDEVMMGILRPEWETRART